MSGWAASMPMASSISWLNRKAPRSWTSLATSGAMLMGAGSLGSIPTWTTIPARRAASRLADTPAGAPEHSRTTSKDSLGTVSVLTLIVAAAPSCFARWRGGGLDIGDDDRARPFGDRAGRGEQPDRTGPRDQNAPSRHTACDADRVKCHPEGLGQGRRADLEAGR